MINIAYTIRKGKLLNTATPEIGFTVLEDYRFGQSCIVSASDHNVNISII